MKKTLIDLAVPLILLVSSIALGTWVMSRFHGLVDLAQAVKI